jgi:hypothetical protein
MRKNLVIVVGAVILSYLLISPFAGDRAVGQQKVVPANGRYQMAVGQIQFGHVIVVLDTQTGQVWRRYHGDSDWSDLGSPTRKAKKE